MDIPIRRGVIAAADATGVDLTTLLPLAAQYAKPPVSNFKVGCVSRGLSGNLYLGANVEFAGEALSFTVHAEQSSIANAWMHGEEGIDLIAQDAVLGITPAGKVAGVVQTSAVTGQGLDTLKLAIEKALSEKSRTYHVHVPHSAGSDIGWLHSHTEIVSRDEPTEQGSGFMVRVEPRHKAAFLERFNGRIESSDA